MDDDKYDPLITQAKAEKTARDKCDCIITLLEMLIKNDIHGLYTGQEELRGSQKELNKKLNRILMLLIGVVMLLVASIPDNLRQLISLFRLIF